MHILLSTDSNYIMPSAVMMKSVSVNNSDEDIIFHVQVDQSVSVKQKKQLENVLTNPRHSVMFHLMDGNVFKDFPSLGTVKVYLSKTAYYRLFVTDVLPPEVHKIIYMDGDVIVRHSLKDLWETDIKECAIGAVTDMAEAKHNFQRLGYNKGLGYFNSGVLLINVDYWREHHLKDVFMNVIINEPQRIELHDQDVLNITLHDCKYKLPMKYNVQNGFLWKSEYNQFGDKYSDYESDLKEAISDPVVVHFTDNKKPWHYEDCNPYGYEFMKYKKQTEWRYSPLTHCYKNKYRHFIAKVLRTFHLIQPTKTQEYLYLPLEVIIGKK